MATKMESDNLAIPLPRSHLSDPVPPTDSSNAKLPKQTPFNPMLSVFSELGREKLTKQPQLLRDILTQKPDLVVPSNDPIAPLLSPSRDNKPNLSTLSCSSCDVTFESRESMLEHYRGDWHRYNLRLQLAGKRPVEEEEFSTILSQDISSISGSDSSDSCSETLLKTPPRLMLYCPGHDSVCSVFRELVHHPSHAPASREELLQLISLIPGKSRCAVLMHSAGHFAGAIFTGDAVLCHKTFHRYVTRAKGGTLQSTHDKMQFARSVGAQMRRANEAALNKDIQELLRNWSDKLSRCDIIFLRIPFYSKHVFYAEGENFGFMKDEPRIRPVPINTRRPTFTEVKRVHSLMTSLLEHGALEELYSDDDVTDLCDVENDDVPSTLPPSQETVGSVLQGLEAEGDPSKKKKTKRPRRAKKNKKSIAALSDPRFSYFHDLMEACASGETPRVLSLLEDIGDPLNFPADSLPPGDPGNLSLEEVKCTEEAVDATGSDDEWVLVNDPLTDSVIEGSDTIDESPDEAQLPETQYVSTDLVRSEDHPQQPTLHSQIEDSIPRIPQENAQPDQESVSWKDLNRETKMSVLQMKNSDGHTPLHLAASKGFSPLIFHFLRYGADPTLRDNMGKVPYEKAKDKASRDAFRRFMFAHPNAYDYSNAKITTPLSPEMEDEQQKKRVEKKKNKNSTKKQKKSQTKGKPAHPQEEGAGEDPKLTKGEKRALAAEKQFMAVKGGEGDSDKKFCAQCTNEMHGSDFFEKSGHFYCSMYCLKKHRQQAVL